MSASGRFLLTPTEFEKTWNPWINENITEEKPIASYEQSRINQTVPLLFEPIKTF